MKTKLLQSFLIGLLLLLVVDFLLFSGLYATYFKELNIKVYFNAVFSDNQIYSLLLILALPFGYLFLKKSIFQFLYLILLILSILPFYKDIGMPLGEMIFSKTVELNLEGKQSVEEIIYIGREYVYLKNPNTPKENKIIKKSLIINGL